MIKKPPRPKKCRNPACGQTFTPKRMGQHVCSPACGLAIKDVNQDKAKKAMAHTERLATRETKERLKTRGDHIKDTQQAFNEFIRLRDQIAGHPCISSGRPLDWSGNAVDAGHYRSRGSAPHLRFDERNCHAQSKQDNRFLSGNIADYRIRLIERIGQDEVASLEADQTVRKYTIEELQAIKKHYRALVREMKKQM